MVKKETGHRWNHSTNQPWSIRWNGTQCTWDSQGKATSMEKIQISTSSKKENEHACIQRLPLPWIAGRQWRCCGIHCNWIIQTSHGPVCPTRGCGRSSNSTTQSPVTELWSKWRASSVLQVSTRHKEHTGSFEWINWWSDPHHHSWTQLVQRAYWFETGYQRVEETINRKQTMEEVQIPLHKGHQW